MEALIFALIATRKGYFQKESVVAEPAEFRNFDLRELERAYRAHDETPSSPSDRQQTLMTQAAS
ncbi:MAG TPA: hypothetical protein VE860_23010 [Chthoniobacterales bacterium]|jgi:hypothetical protein|nr:hypothetical protein [Chthoniobacterales bacterium]